MKHVMIDLETLATTADAVVMSIGAVEFELEGAIGRTIYRSVSIEQPGRRISEDTLIWWMQQSEEARKVFFEPKVQLTEALRDLADWYPQDARAWSNGASFDIAILEHAYARADMDSPWAFYDSRCVRTYRDLPGAQLVERVQPGVAHNALEDALAQVKHLQAIHATLFAKEHA